MNEEAGIHLKWSDSCFFSAISCVWLRIHLYKILTQEGRA
jgi:hypothetical protein